MSNVNTETVMTAVGLPNDLGLADGTWQRNATPPRVQFGWNLRLLLVSMIVVGIIGGLAGYSYVIHSSKIEKQLLRMAAGAEQEGNWQRQQSLLRRYLQLRPNDSAAMRQLADVYFVHADTVDDVRAGIQLYARCLQKDQLTSQAYSEPKLRLFVLRSILDPRSGLADLDEWLGHDDVAERLFADDPLMAEVLKARISVREKYLSTFDVDQQSEARRILLADYELLAKHAPNEPEILQNLAFHYRRMARVARDLDEKQINAYSEHADQLMDDAVNLRPRDVQVLMRRAEYLRRFRGGSLDAIAADLRRVLEISPNHPPALGQLALLLANRTEWDSELSIAPLAASESFLSTSVKQAGATPQSSVLMMRLQDRLGRRTEARRTIETAKSRFPDDHAVQVAWTQMAISENRFDDADRGIGEIQRIARRGRYLDPVWRTEINRTRIEAAQADVLQAERLLNDDRVTGRHERGARLLGNIDIHQLHTHERADILQQLATMFARLERWDDAIEALESARRIGDLPVATTLLLAKCYQASNQLRHAIELCEASNLRGLSDRDAVTILYLLGSMYLEQDARAAPNRSAAANAHRRLKSRAPNAEETFLLGLLIEFTDSPIDREQILTRLREAEPRYQHSPRYWMLSQQIYRRLEEFSSLRRASSRLLELVQRQPSPTALMDTGQPLIAKLKPADNEFLQLATGNWAEQTAEAKATMIRQWMQNSAESLAPRFALANLGMKHGKLDWIDEAIDSLRSLETDAGLMWQIVRVHRDLTAYRDGNESAADTAKANVERLLREHPGNASVEQLAGLCFETCGELRRASRHYRRSSDSNDGVAATTGWLRTATHLRNWEQAARALDRIQTPYRSADDRCELVVHVLCSLERFGEALELADQIKQRSADPRVLGKAEFLRAVVLRQQGGFEQLMEAERALRTSLEHDPTNMGYWVALYHLLINEIAPHATHHARVAAIRIKWLVAAADDAPGDAWTALILAHCLRFQSRLSDADEMYRKATKSGLQNTIPGSIPWAVVSQSVPASDAAVTSPIAWLFGHPSARTLTALRRIILAGELTDGEYPIHEQDHRVAALVQAANGELPQALASLERLPQARMGGGDWLLMSRIQAQLGNLHESRALLHRCLTSERVALPVLTEVLNTAMAKSDSDLLRKCLERHESAELPAWSRALAMTQIELDDANDDGRNDGWQEMAISRLVQLEDVADRRSLAIAVAERTYLLSGWESANQWFDNLTMHESDARSWQSHWSATKQEGQSQSFELLIESVDRSLVDQAVEMLYRMSTVPQASADQRDRLRDTAITLWADRVLSDPVHIFKLAWSLEHLQMLEEARSAAELARERLGEMAANGGALASPLEHYLVWLACCYGDGHDVQDERIRSLILRIGPIADIVDTQATLALRQGRYENANRFWSEAQVLRPFDRSLEHKQHVVDAFRQADPGQRRTKLSQLRDSFQWEEFPALKHIVDNHLEQPSTSR